MILHKLDPTFLDGAKQGFQTAFPQSIGLIPWALVTGVAMASAGLTPAQAMGMNIFVYAGVAQLGTLPLIVEGAPIWLIIVTALVLNLRFFIFSAAISQGFRDMRDGVRWVCSYLLIDGVIAACLARMLEEGRRRWRLGYYLWPAVWSWMIWQTFALIGVLAANAIPKNLSLEFMATIALLVILLPMTKLWPMLIAATTSGALAVLLRDMPLRLGMVAAIFAGITAGLISDRWLGRRSLELR